MRVFLQHPEAAPNGYASCYLALLDWYVDQIEWSRPERLKGAPIDCGRTVEDFLVRVQALVERQFGGRLVVPSEGTQEERCRSVLTRLSGRKILRFRMGQ